MRIACRYMLLPTTCSIGSDDWHSPQVWENSGSIPFGWKCWKWPRGRYVQQDISYSSFAAAVRISVSSMRLFQTSDSCSHSWNKTQLVNLGNFISIRGWAQGYYALFVDNSAPFADEIPNFKFRDVDFIRDLLSWIIQVKWFHFVSPYLFFFFRDVLLLYTYYM